MHDKEDRERARRYFKNATGPIEIGALPRCNIEELQMVTPKYSDPGITQVQRTTGDGFTDAVIDDIALRQHLTPDELRVCTGIH